MEDDVASTPDRRGFLGQAAAMAIAPAILGKPFGFAGGDTGESAETAAGGMSGARSRAAWDMSWVDGLAGAKHKAVFDATQITNGLSLGHVDLYLRGYREVYGVEERDVRAVLVIRHEAVPMFLNDAFWAKYRLGQTLRITDPSTGASAVRNPFSAQGAKAVPEWNTIQQLRARGVAVLGCATALRSVAGLMAAQTGQAASVVEAEAMTSLVTGVVIMPSGIFAILRAQEAGCGYVRST